MQSTKLQISLLSYSATCCWVRMKMLHTPVKSVLSRNLEMYTGNGKPHAMACPFHFQLHSYRKGPSYLQMAVWKAAETASSGYQVFPLLKIHQAAPLTTCPELPNTHLPVTKKKSAPEHLKELHKCKIVLDNQYLDLPGLFKTLRTPRVTGEAEEQKLPKGQQFRRAFGLLTLFSSPSMTSMPLLLRYNSRKFTKLCSPSILVRRLLWKCNSS